MFVVRCFLRLDLQCLSIYWWDALMDSQTDSRICMDLLRKKCHVNIRESEYDLYNWKSVGTSHLRFCKSLQSAILCIVLFYSTPKKLNSLDIIDLLLNYCKKKHIVSICFHVCCVSSPTKQNHWHLRCLIWTEMPGIVEEDCHVPEGTELATWMKGDPPVLIHFR